MNLKPQICLPVFILLISLTAIAQPAPAKTTSLISLERATAYMDLLYTDGTDMYSLKTQNNIKKTTLTQSLCKFNANLGQVYEASLNKLIGDRFFEGLICMKGRFYLFTGDITDKKKNFTLFGIELDKATGNPIGTEKVIQTYERHSNWDGHKIRVLPNEDSTRFIILGTNDNKDDDIFYVTLADADMNTLLYVPADPRIPNTQHYRLNEVVVDNNNVILTGQHFDLIRNGAGTIWKPKGYHMFRFDAKGKKVSDQIFKLEGKFPGECKLYKLPQGLALAGTYYDDELKPQIKGCFLAKLDASNLSTTTVSFQPFTSDQVFNRDLDASFPGIGAFYFSKMNFNASTGKFYFIAETFDVRLTADTYFYQIVTYGGEGGVSRKTDSWKNADTYTFHFGDILVMEAGSDLKVSRHFLVSKRQMERMTDNIETGYPGLRDAAVKFPPNDYLFPMAVAPLYSSYAAHWMNGKLYLIYNDQIRKKEAAQDKDFVQAFKGSPLTASVIDLNSGNITNQKIKDNEGLLTFMPRYALGGANGVYVPSLYISTKVDCNFKVGLFALTQ